jgi:two-component system, OmpR family, sensor histidine kinase ChvG
MTIRSKLLLLSIAVLSIPYVGYQYLREMEQYLRDSLEASLTDSAIAIAGPLHNQESYFPLSTEPLSATVFVHKLPHPIQLDGYTDDWQSYISWSDSYVSNQIDSKDPTSFKFIISRYQQYYYALLQVNDIQHVFRIPGTPAATDNDHIILVFSTPSGEINHYIFSPTDAGEFTPFELVDRVDEFGFSEPELSYKTNVSAVWRETDKGYNLEMAIPVNVVGDRLGIIVNDVDDPYSRTIVTTVNSAGNQTITNPGRILQSATEIEKTIESYARSEGRRIWVLDNNAQVLASVGNLAKDLTAESINLFYSLLLPPVHQRFSDDLSGASRLQGEEINEALKGNTGSRWRTSPDDRTIIVSAAAPILVNGVTRGVVVVEETTSQIQLQQRQAMASLFNKSLFVFAFVTILLLLFATRLSIRIRQLEKDAAAAIDKHGRVVGNFQTSKSADEIGHLSRNYAAMLARLRNYNEYLENMAGRLSHELRTPIAVVQSSLDQFNDTGTGDEKEIYLERARQGINRLNMLVVRLSEATRLEQALQSTDKHPTNVPELLNNCIEGYRIAFPEIQFSLSLPAQDLIQSLATDLLVQMLDKLVMNAIDFKSGTEPIETRLEVDSETWNISVINYGSKLPENMVFQLFNSMISLREKNNKDEPHLGLGLYIVRLIVEYHGGHVSASNLEDREGVIVTASFPLSS